MNDVHKRCILNSIEFCTHLEILKKNFQGCLSVQLSKFIALKFSIYLCLRSFRVAHLSWRLDYNSTYQVLCQQLFSFYLENIERRRRDLNPRAAINDLLPFQGSPFSRLGTSPQAPKSTGYVRPVECIERRGWDSNPRALADKRFSRPPRYDHFDTSPCAL